MAFTYDPATNRGRVRLLLADTRAENAWFSDEEIDAALSVQTSVEGAVGQLAHAALAHAARHSSARSRSGGGTSESMDDTSRVEAWRALADVYRPYMSTRMPAVRSTLVRGPNDIGWIR